MTDEQENNSEEITLSKEQLKNSLKNCDNLIRYGKVLDTSNVGEGKSVMMSWCLKHLEIEAAIMICPSSLIPMWEEYKRKYDLPFRKIVSYETLKGMKTDFMITLKHELLKRTEDNEYLPTTKLKRMIKRNSFVVCCDESYKIKNDCYQQQAVKEIISCVNYYRDKLDDGKIRGFYFNCTTPFDKKIHLVNFCRTTSVIKNKYLFFLD